MNKLIVVAAMLCFSVSSISQTVAKPVPPADKTKLEDQVKLLQTQVQNLQGQSLYLAMKLNRQQIQNLQDKIQPLQEFRNQLIEQINKSNPGKHWDDRVEDLVDNPKVPTPPVKPTAPGAPTTPATSPAAPSAAPTTSSKK